MLLEVCAQNQVIGQSEAGRKRKYKTIVLCYTFVAGVFELQLGVTSNSPKAVYISIRIIIHFYMGISSLFNKWGYEEMPCYFVKVAHGGKGWRPMHDRVAMFGNTWD